VEICFTPNLEEVVDIARRVSIFRWGVFILLVLLTMLAVEGLYLIHQGFTGGHFWLAMAALLGFAPWSIPRYLARRFLSRKSAESETTFQFQDEGVSITGSIGTAQLKWRAFSKFEETDRMFFLHFRSGRFNSVPKRVMSPEQIAELRNILKLRIGAARR